MKWLKDYKQLKYPEGAGDGLIFSFASGRVLDGFGIMHGIKRRKFLFIKESDYFYKIRLRNHAIKEYEHAAEESC